jgi:hypothetical protein
MRGECCFLQDLPNVGASSSKCILHPAFEGIVLVKLEYDAFGCAAILCMPNPSVTRILDIIPPAAGGVRGRLGLLFYPLIMSRMTIGC